MALLFADNFGWYTASQRLRWWSREDLTGDTISVGPYGPAGISAMRFAAGALNGIEIRNLPVSGAVCIIGVRVKLTGAYPTADNFILTVCDTGTGHAGPFQVTLDLDSAGQLKAVRGFGTSRTVLATSTYVLPLDVWLDVWLTTTIHNSAGTFKVEVYEPGATEPEVPLDLTGVDTQDTANAAWDGIGIGDWSEQGVTDFAHVVVLDGSGAAPLNAALGLVTVATCRPRADGTHQDWTPEPGASHHGMVRDSVADDDVTRVTAAAGLTNTYGMQETPQPTATIYGVVTALMAKKAGSGAVSPTLAPVIRHGGSDTVGSNASLGDAYQGLRTVYPTAPDATAWTPAKWNAIEIGHERTA